MGTSIAVTDTLTASFLSGGTVFVEIVFASVALSSLCLRGCFSSSVVSFEGLVEGRDACDPSSAGLVLSVLSLLNLEDIR